MIWHGCLRSTYFTCQLWYPTRYWYIKSGRSGGFFCKTWGHQCEFTVHQENPKQRDFTLVILDCISRPFQDHFFQGRIKYCHFLDLKLDSDEPPHQICSYTLLFSLFHCFLYVDPPLCTPTLTWPHMLTQNSHLLHQTNLAYLMDTCFVIHMFYFYS